MERGASNGEGSSVRRRTAGTLASFVGLACSLAQIVVCSVFGWEVALAPHAQVAADEGFEIAVEDLVDVAYFNAGAEVFGHAVRLEDVAANL